MKSLIASLLVLISVSAEAWQVTISCASHGKNKADVEELILKSTDGKASDGTGVDIEIAGVAKKVTVSKKSFNEVSFKGFKSQSIKGSYYTLETVPEHTVVKSIKITASTNDDVGSDELLTTDKKIFPMTCNEIETLECAVPEKTAKIPKESIWAGGCDGGAWIQIMALKGNKAHLKIYFADSGNIWKDGWYEFTENCQVKSKDILKTDFSSFDGSIVHLKRINPKEEPPQSCYMKPVEK